MDRRTFLTGLTVLPVAEANAQDSMGLSLRRTEVIPLWQGTPPGGGHSLPAYRVVEHSPNPDAFHNRVATGIAEPVLCAIRPRNPDGSAMLIAPGGGYRELWIDNEGFDVANRFSTDGVTAFVLLYRLPAEGWLAGRNVPLQDAQRAMRLIRSHASTFGIDPAHVGAIGFSAGGHLIASLAVRADSAVYDPQDAADTLSAKPAFAALFYPVVTMLPPYAHEASREMLLGSSPSTTLRRAYSCEKLVTAATPPTFLLSALDDTFVAPENTTALFSALRSVGVSQEMHLFERGGHGFGMRGAAGEPVSAWPELLLRWGTANGFFGRTRLPNPHA